MTTIKVQVRSRQRRSALIRIASDLFIEKGYERTSIDEMVRVAGGSKSNVYSAFGGKLGLFKEAVETLCADTVISPVAALDYSGLDLEASLTKFGEALLTYILRKRALALDRLILSEAARCPEIGSVWYKYGPLESQRACATLIAAHINSKRIGLISPDHLAVQFHSMLVWDVQHRALAGMVVTRSMVRETVKDAVQIFMSYLKNFIPR
jgi:AcrR family transcriptional regulator